MNKESVEAFLTRVKWATSNTNTDHYDDLIFVASLTCLSIRAIDLDHFTNKYERKLHMPSDIRHIGVFALKYFFILRVLLRFKTLKKAQKNARFANSRSQNVYRM